MDAGYLIFWPGAVAVAGFVAFPVALGLQKLKRRFGRARNAKWHCAQCDRPLVDDHLANDVFLAHGCYVCSACADTFRRRYRVALVLVPTVAALAGIATVTGLVLDTRPVSWYVGLPLFSILLPSVGVGSAFWWRIRVAKNANRRSLLDLSDGDGAIRAPARGDWSAAGATSSADDLATDMQLHSNA